MISSIFIKKKENKMIKVDNLSKRFGNKIALEDISFDIKEGEIFGFLGPSGAGKTTTINILTGQLSQDSGKAYILNKESNQLLPSDFLNIGIMSDTVGFYGKMTVYKNLQFFAKYHNVSLDKLDVLLKELELFEDKDKKAEKLSTGMKQRMLLIRSILHHPKILFLDEPTSGLDPALSNKVHDILLNLKNEGTTIFLTTHDMSEATKICDRISLLNLGHILEYGSPQEIIDKYSQQDKAVIRFKNGDSIMVSQAEAARYLGGSDVASVHTLENTLEDIFIKVSEDSKNV